MYLMIVYMLVLSLAKNTFCSNILIASPVPSPSHQIWNYALAKGLIDKGHNITMAGPDTNMHKASEKYHPIVFEDILKKMSESLDVEESPNKSVLEIMTTFNYLLYVSCKYLYESNGFQQILNYPKDYKFDLIIIDVTVGPCLHPLIQRFSYPPTIGITAFLLPPYTSFDFGNYLPSSYLPHYLLQYPQTMTFSERVVNYLVTNIDLLYKQTFEKWNIQKLANGAFGFDVDRLEDLEKHISLLLCNFNPILHYPQPLTTNIIPVGGLHARAPSKLPEDIQQIMDKSTNGVILMSLGTNVHSDKIEKSKRDAIINAFSQLNQTVLWKFESDLDNLPSNVIIRKFLPQNDILGHPNTKLFISHGGGLSTLETAYHGVPILGIPFLADQFMLTNIMTEKKLGIKLEFPDITYERLLNTINELLYNTEYSKNMKEVSRIMKDQISSPLETAVFWAEYAIRHNGTQYLNPKSRNMPLFISSSTDVVSFLLIIFSIFLYTTYVIIRFLYKYLTSEKKKVKKN